MEFLTLLIDYLTLFVFTATCGYVVQKFLNRKKSTPPPTHDHVGVNKLLNTLSTSEDKLGDNEAALLPSPTQVSNPILDAQCQCASDNDSGICCKKGAPAKVLSAIKVYYGTQNGMAKVSSWRIVLFWRYMLVYRSLLPMS